MPSVYFSSIVKSCSNPFLERTSTKQKGYSVLFNEKGCMNKLPSLKSAASPSSISIHSEWSDKNYPICIEGQSSWHALSYTFINSVFTDKTPVFKLSDCICGLNGQT